MFPPGANNGYEGRDADWRTGISLWTQDYPARPHFSEAIRRLTRISVTVGGAAVNLDAEEEFDWRGLAVQVANGASPTRRPGRFGNISSGRASSWRRLSRRGRVGGVSRKHAPRVSRPANRGDRKFRCDFPHVYDTDTRFQMPGAEHLRLGYKNNGTVPHWRAIRDDKGRVMVAISSLRHRRCVGVGGFGALPGTLFRPGDPAWRELCGLCDDALISFPAREEIAIHAIVKKKSTERPFFDRHTRVSLLKRRLCAGNIWSGGISPEGVTDAIPHNPRTRDELLLMAAADLDDDTSTMPMKMTWTSTMMMMMTTRTWMTWETMKSSTRTTKTSTRTTMMKTMMNEDEDDDDEDE